MVKKIERFFYKLVLKEYNFIIKKTKDRILKLKIKLLRANVFLESMEERLEEIVEKGTYL